MQGQQKTRLLRNQTTQNEEPFYKILGRLEREAGLAEAIAIRRLQVPRSTYRSWKDGTSEPSKRIYWIKLSEVLGCSLDQLLRGGSDIDSELRIAFVAFANFVKARVDSK